LLILTTIFCILQYVNCQGTQQQYCSLYSEHTCCKNTGFGAACTTGYTEVKPSAAQKTEILTWHNNIRKKTANGLETLARDVLPKASNMRSLVWDTELAHIAQTLANTCKFGHDCNKCRDCLNAKFIRCGQNIAWAWTSQVATSINFTRVINPWYADEVKNFQASYVPSFPASSPNGVIGHYTQAIWAETQAVGCGGILYKEQGGTSSLVVCNYGIGGNLIGTPVYKSGTPCSACPSGTTCSTPLCV